MWWQNLCRFHAGRRKCCLCCLLPTSGGTLAVQNRLQNSLWDWLSAVWEEMECLTAPGYTLSSSSCPCHTPHDRTFLCREALITWGLWKGREREKKTDERCATPPKVEGFCNSNKKQANTMILAAVMLYEGLIIYSHARRLCWSFAVAMTM